jgi:hypothetical protein
VDLPGAGGEVRVTRNELDDAIRAPLDGFVAELQETLRRSGIRSTDLVAVASVGGGARIPIVTTTLSEHLRVPVITAAQPELAAAIGGGLSAVRGTAPEGATSLAPAAAAALTPDPPAAPMSSTVTALAWSDADDVPEVAPVENYGDYDHGVDDGDAARPRLAFEEPEPDAQPAAAPVPWFRRSGVIAGLVLLAVFAAIAAVVLFVFRSDESTGPTGDTTPTTTTAATPTPTTTNALPPTASATPPPLAPSTRTVTRQAPPPVVTATQPPPSTEPPPAPTPTEEQPPPPPVESTPPPSTQPPLIPTLPYETIPGLPFVPAPVQPPPP